MSWFHSRNSCNVFDLWSLVSHMPILWNRIDHFTHSNTKKALWLFTADNVIHMFITLLYSFLNLNYLIQFFLLIILNHVKHQSDQKRPGHLQAKDIYSMGLHGTGILSNKLKVHSKSLKCILFPLFYFLCCQFRCGNVQCRRRGIKKNLRKHTLMGP